MRQYRVVSTDARCSELLYTGTDIVRARAAYLFWRVYDDVLERRTSIVADPPEYVAPTNPDTIIYRVLVRWTPSLRRDSAATDWCVRVPYCGPCPDAALGAFLRAWCLDRDHGPGLPCQRTVLEAHSVGPFDLASDTPTHTTDNLAVVPR